MNYGLIFEKEELKGNNYYILKEISLCEEKEEGIYILMGEHKGEILSKIDPSNEDLLQVDVVSFDELKTLYNTFDMEEIGMELAYNINTPFVFNNNELVSFNENLYTYLKITDKVVGQDEGIKRLISIIQNNQVLNSLTYSNEKKKINKRNAVIMGKTGVGKSLIVKELKENIDLPVYITKLDKEDESSNMFDIFLNLLKESEGNIELAKNGVVVIDDLSDKERYKIVGDLVLLAGKYNFNYLLDTGPITFEVDEEEINFDFSNLTFIFLVNAENRKINDKKVGFENTSENTDNSLNKYFNDDTINRITDLVILNEMNKDMYIEILLNSSISPLYIKIEELNNMGITFNYDMEFISLIADKALEINQGAFGLIKAVNEVFSLYEFEIITNDYEEIEFKGKKLIKKR